MRNVIVTGGTRGLGLAISHRLAETGHTVIMVARSSGAAEDLPRVNGARKMYFRRLDLSELAAIPETVGTIAREFGGVFGLVNCAGIGNSGLLATMPERTIDQLIAINLSAPMIMAKHAVRAMMVHGEGGRIVSISSVAAETGYSGLAVYAATKAALGGFSRSLAREVGPLGITVNCVAPGFVDTDMTNGITPRDRTRILRRSPIGHLPEAGDVADAVAYLMGDAGRRVTGTTLTVDAGYSA